MSSSASTNYGTDGTTLLSTATSTYAGVTFDASGKITSGSPHTETVNADGSGSATFKNLQDTDGNAVNGSETWTCS